MIKGINQGFVSLAPIYKFYLAFENSNCFEYITEKYWKTLGQNVIPVVRGAANYKEIAPENSYIDVNDFESPESLAKHLLYLDENDDKYLEYFSWTHKTSLFKPRIFCQLCSKLNDVLEPVKIYENITDWWLHDNKNLSVCDI